MNLSAVVSVKRGGGGDAFAVTKDAAKQALTRFKAKPKMEFIDPTDESQIQAYMNLRRTIARLDATTFAKYLKGQTDTLQSGSKTKIDYWAVPKENFPDATAFPTDVREGLVEWEDLGDLELLGGDAGRLNYDDYYVVDQMVSRGRLGRNVHTISFFTGGGREFRANTGGGAGALPRAAPAPAFAGRQQLSAPGGDAAMDDELEVEGPRPAAPATPMKASEVGSPGRGLNRRSSEPASPNEEPIAKRRRLLREALKDLERQILEAAVKGHWASTSEWDHENVVYSVGELLSVLDGLREDSLFREASAVVVGKITLFLTDLLSGYPTFDILPQFQSSFDRLSAMGADTSGAFGVLCRLALHPAQEVAVFDLSGSDVVTRNNFRKTRLFQSYCEHTCNLLLQDARSRLQLPIPDVAKALEKLEAAQSIHPVSDGLRDTVRIAIFCFGRENDAIQKLEFLLKNEAKGLPGHCKFLRDWAPNQPLTRAAQLLLPFPDLSTWTFANWLVGVDYLNAEFVCVNPAVCASITLVSEMKEVLETTSLPEGFYQLAGKLVTLRLSLNLETEVETYELARWAQNDGLGSVDRKKLIACVSRFLKVATKSLTIPSDLEDFLTEMKAQWEADKEARKSRQQAEAEEKDEAARRLLQAGGQPAAAAGDGNGKGQGKGKVAELRTQFRSDITFRDQVQSAQKMLSECVGSIVKIDEICNRSGAMPLKILFADKLKDQEDDRLSAQLMLDILQEFATKADAEVLALANADAAGENASPSVALPPAAAEAEANANPRPTPETETGAPAARIAVGDIVIGRASKFKEKYDNVRAKVTGVLSTQYKVEMLEGKAKGEPHKYVKSAVRLADRPGGAPETRPPTPEAETRPPTLPESGGGAAVAPAVADAVDGMFDDLFQPF